MKILHFADLHLGVESYGRIGPATGISSRLLDFLAALDRVVDYAFNELGLTLLGLTVFPSNQRAIRAYEKVGFRKTEVLEDSGLLPDGGYADVWVTELGYTDISTVDGGMMAWKGQKYEVERMPR